DLSQYALQGTVVQADQIVEDEHQLADFGGKFRVRAIKIFEDLFLRSTVDSGEHVHEELGAADGCEIAADHRAQLPLEHLLRLLHHLRWSSVHGGDAQCDFSAQVR